MALDVSFTHFDMPTRRASLPDPRAAVTRGLCLLGGLALAVIVATQLGLVDASKLLHALGGIDQRLLAVVIALSFANYGLRALRWHLLTRQVAPEVPLAASVSYVLTGFAFLLTPGKVGEIVRAWLLKTRHDVPYNRSLALLVLDRLADLAALILIAAVGAAAGFARSAGHNGWSELAGGMAGVTLTVLALLALLSSRRLVVALVRAGHALTGRRWPGLFVFALETDRTLRRVSRPSVLAVALLLGVAAWAVQIVGIWLALTAFGFSGGLLQAAVIYPAAMIIGAAAMVPGGADAVLLGFLVMAGMETEAAVVATFVARLATWWLAMAVGICVAPVVLARRDR